jgi:hypothetical protein
LKGKGIKVGTINYFTSDYITIGLNPDTLNYDEIEWIYDCIKEELNNYSFWYYKVTIEPGYYEGFSIRIESEYSYYDNYEEKQEVQKEITKIKNFLLDCVESGLCAVSPGWCTTYHDYDESRRRINKAIKEMRNEVKTARTWYNICKA